MAKMLNVEVVYGLPERQHLIEFTVEQGTTVEQAIVQSGIVNYFSEIDPSTASVGIFSRVVKLQYELKEGERVEIYRPLIADPKELRRLRAEKAKEEGRASKVTGGRPKSHP